MDNYGFVANGDFAPAYAAAQAQLKQRFLKSRGDLEQSLAERGVRSSGVGALPTAELASGETQAQAGLIGQFGEQQTKEGLTDKRIAEQQAWEAAQAQLAFDRNASLQNTLARKQLQGQLIGAGIGAAGSAAAGYLGG